MNRQRIFVKGRTFEVSDPALQTALAAIYETPERPRCLCVEGGVDLYISRRSSVTIWRGCRAPATNTTRPARTTNPILPRRGGVP